MLTKDLHYLLLYLDSLTSSLIPLKPWDDSSGVIRPTVEIEEFSQAFPEAAHPYTSYVNNLYVYPLSLNYSNQKVFSKVSNLLVIERAFLLAAFWVSLLIFLQLQIDETNREWISSPFQRSNFRSESNFNELQQQIWFISIWFNTCEFNLNFDDLFELRTSVFPFVLQDEGELFRRNLGFLTAFIYFVPFKWSMEANNPIPATNATTLTDEG